MGQVRVGWVDTARGIAIIAVVVYHAALFLTAVGWGGVWLDVMNVLETFRMPLFFFAAGLFSAKILRQSLGELWRKRIALFLYLYVVWSLIRVVFFQFVPFVLPSSNAADWWEFLTIFIWPNGGLWFIYALALFSLFVWVFRKAPAWVPVSISVIVSIVAGSGLVSIGNTSWTKTATYVAFFVAAVYIRDWALLAAKRLRPWMIGALLVSYPVLAIAITYVPLVRAIPGARFLVSVVGVAFGVALSVALADRVKVLSHLGRNTLPIYLIHYLPIAGAAAAVSFLGVDPAAIGEMAATPILTLGAITASLWVAHLLRNVHGVFDLPQLRMPSRAREEAL